jgi:uncharacterized protein (AIM24 family)
METTPQTTAAGAADSDKYSADAFLRAFVEKGGVSADRFEQEGQRVLRIDVTGSAGVLIKPGSAIAYRGDIRFERLATLGADTLREMAAREITPFVRALGEGRLYCANKGWHVHLLHLDGGTVFVNGDMLLAFEETLEHEITLPGIAGVFAGGFFTVKLSGKGMLALAIHGAPLTLPVAADSPVSTDPKATIGWSSGLRTELKTDLSWRSLIGRGGEEPIQFRFEGEGYVAVQPSEGAPRFTGKRLKALIGL